MKKCFTISAVILLASSAVSAQPALKTLKTRANTAPNFMTAALQNADMFEKQTKPVQLQVDCKNARLVMAPDDFGRQNAPASGKSGAFYEAVDGTYYMSLDIASGMYGYARPTMISQAFSATFRSPVASSWSVVGDPLECIKNEDGTTEVCYSDYSIGGWVAPTVSNGVSSYYYGADGVAGTGQDFSRAVVYTAYHTKPVSMGVYEVNECGIGGNLNGDYPYGSMSVNFESDVTMIDFGKPKGGSLVVDHIELWGINRNNTEPIKDDAYLTVKLVTIGDDGKTVKDVYDSQITAGDLVSVGSGSYIVSCSFSQTDDDNFTMAVAPVINDAFRIYISGFSNPNIDLGIAASVDENATDEGIGYTANSYFQADMGAGMHYYSWYNCNAIVNIVGYYNYLGSFDGEKMITGTIVPEGGVSVVSIDEENGNIYNFYEINSTFNIDDIEIEEMPEWLSVAAFDTSYYAYSDPQHVHNLVAIALGADALPAGVDGRTGDVILTTSDGAASMTLRVIQGSNEYINGIDNVKVSGAACRATVAGDDIVVSCPADVKTVNLYNAAGALVSTVAVENGKAVIKNAPAGLNLVNFNGKQSVKVVK